MNLNDHNFIMKLLLHKRKGTLKSERKKETNNNICAHIDVYVLLTCFIYYMCERGKGISRIKNQSG